MNLKTYLSEKRGRLVDLAEKIGAHHPDVSDWSRGKRRVPIHYCFAIEKATDGEVTRRDLRPDDWQLIWPDLVEPATEQ